MKTFQSEAVWIWNSFQSSENPSCQWDLLHSRVFFTMDRYCSYQTLHLDVMSVFQYQTWLYDQYNIFFTVEIPPPKIVSI